MIDHAEHPPMMTEHTSWREVYPDTRNLRPERDAHGVVVQKTWPQDSPPVDRA